MLEITSTDFLENLLLIQVNRGKLDYLDDLISYYRTTDELKLKEALKYVIKMVPEKTKYIYELVILYKKERDNINYLLYLCIGDARNCTKCIFELANNNFTAKNYYLTKYYLHKGMDLNHQESIEMLVKYHYKVEIDKTKVKQIGEYGAELGSLQCIKVLIDFYRFVEVNPQMLKKYLLMGSKQNSLECMYQTARYFLIIEQNIFFAYSYYLSSINLDCTKSQAEILNLIASIQVKKRDPVVQYNEYKYLLDYTNSIKPLLNHHILPFVDELRRRLSLMMAIAQTSNARKDNGVARRDKQLVLSRNLGMSITSGTSGTSGPPKKKVRFG